MSTFALDCLVRSVEEGRPFDASAYTDDALFRLERARVFDDHWLACAPEDAASDPGAWHRARDADPRLVIARDANLELCAWFDVCRHRGAPLLPEEDAGRERALCVECPYHGWRYAMDGALLSPRSAREDGAARGLVRAEVQRHAAQTWVRYDEARGERAVHAPPWLIEVANAPISRARSVRWEVRANWKLVVENFQESHHFARVHPALEALTPWKRSSSECDPSRRWLSGFMPLVDGAETVSTSAKLRGRTPIVRGADELRVVRDAYVFPNALYSRQPDYLLVYRLFAAAVDRTVLHCDTLVHGASTDAHRFMLDEVFSFWDRVHEEDREVCEGQQRCAGSRGFRPTGYDASEDGVRAFDAMVAGALTG
ncbi:MAG: Rieske 2Fe-2S domain-containing protein [Myxococcales bacterium]|nr:Rieske 2Fe-2S domain-containing protein [Myxococcales bacterium]